MRAEIAQGCEVEFYSSAPESSLSLEMAQVR